MSKHTSILSELTAVSSLDGRYRSRVEELAPIISEYGLIKNRIIIEAKYLLALSVAGATRKFKNDETKLLSEIADGKITDDDIEKVKEIEKETRHDVKAVERMLRVKLEQTTLKDQLEKIHFGLTSEDVNNLSYRLQLKVATNEILIPILIVLIEQLMDRAERFKSLPMLARTHGQAAIPTTVGKEFAVFATRLNKQLIKLQSFRLSGKLTGAVGNFNALQYTYPEIDWINFSEDFVTSLGLEPNLNTTQINPTEDIVEIIQIYQRLNGIIIDFDQDMWRYISDHWFIQAAVKGEVGSSTMPQKVNPIDFENSEGRLGIANSMGDYFVRKLPISRLQRDLSDSTVLREMGTFLGNSLIGYKSTSQGLLRVEPNKDQIDKALNSDWSILGEGVQTLLRKTGIADPYSLISSLTRGGTLNPEKWSEWVEGLLIDEKIKTELKKLTPESYIGLSVELTEKAIAEIKSSRKDK
ncbi:MAG TPA: adenylosuccinate lyase [Xanthomonadales bacterium]|nr:adenylosuccinate lyase [Xanthomonadales bacterium]